MTTQPVLPAKFYPQVWIRDHAVDIDETLEFDAFPALMRLDTIQFNRIRTTVLKTFGSDLDVLAEESDVLTNPILVGPKGGSFNGPFRVTVEREDFLRTMEDLGISPYEATDSEQWNAIRRKHSSPKAAIPLYSGNISDWRMADTPAGIENSGLTETQKQPWAVEIIESGYGGIDMRFVGPDGVERSILVEIDKGTVKINTYRGNEQTEEPDTLIRIQEDFTSVEFDNREASSGFRKSGYIAFTPDLFTLHDGDPLEDEADTTPKI